MFVLRIASVLCFAFVFVSCDDNCNIGLYTRKQCKLGQVITDGESCLALGCCFDPNGPTLGKCYKKGRAITFGGFSFTATVPPSTDNLPGIVNVGGESGFPGSQIRLECNPFRRCKVNYGKQSRAECIRQGCCFQNNQCYQNTIKILRLRNKCPPGYSDPPACNVINPCVTAKPCLNNGVCTFTGPGAFSCACPTGFSGTTCTPNCKAPYVYGAFVTPQPVGGDYPSGASINIYCNADHKVQEATPTTTRTCKEDGQFYPLLSVNKITCSKDCVVESQAGVKADHTEGTTVNHDDVVKYKCNTGSVADKASMLARTCKNGTLSPSLAGTPILCHEDCTIEVPNGAKSDKTGKIQFGQEFKLSCDKGYTPDKSNVNVHKCTEKGAISPAQSDFKCYADCKAATPEKSIYEVIGGGVKSPDHVYPHGTKLKYACDLSHTHQTGATVETTCSDGNFGAVNLVCQKDCKLSSLPDYDHDQGTRTSVHHGEIVTFRCKKGYSNPAGSVRYQCVNSGFNTDTAFVCNRDCPRPNNDINLTFDPALPSPTMLHGTKFTIGCSGDYTPVTSSATLSRECRDGHVEAKDLVVCKAACLPKVVSNTVIVESGVFHHKDPITYRCAAHHVQKTESLMKRTCVNSVTSPDPAAGTDAIVCYKPCDFQTPPNSKLVTSTNTVIPSVTLNDGSVLGMFIHGTTFQLSCVATHTQLASTTAAYECKDGNLGVAVDFACTKDCTAPAVDGVKFSTLTKYSLGLSVTASCDPGLVLTGTANRKCGANGIFTPLLTVDVPKCNKPCKASTPANSIYQVVGGGPKAADHTYLHGTKLTYSCEKQHSHQADATVATTCQDGNFAAVNLVCNKECSIDDFKAGKNYGHNKGSAVVVDHGVTVKFHCDTSFSNPDAAELEVTCTNSQFLPATPFVCYKDCPAPNTVLDGSFKPGTAVKHGREQTFKCNNGWTSLPGVDLTPTCQNGNYLYDPAGVIECFKDCTPEVLANGDYTTKGETTKKTTYHHNEKIEYACKNKHSDSVDPSALTRTCINGHFSPKFSDDKTPIICLPDCEVPDRPDTTRIPVGKLLPENNKVVYSCSADGHALAVDVPATRTCIEGALSPAMQGTTDIVCYQTCEEIKLDNQVITPSHPKTGISYRHGTTLTYTCAQGYALPRGVDGKTKCGSNGRYTVDPNTFTCLKTCGAPETPSDGAIATHVLTSPFRVDDKLTYKCNSGWGHEHVSSAIADVVCQASGQFSPTLADSKFECKKECNVVDIGNLKKPLPTLKHLDTFQYECAQGFSMIPGAYNQFLCNDGTFDYKNKPSSFIPPKCHLKCTIPSGMTNVVFKVGGLVIPPGAQMDHLAFVDLSCSPDMTGVGINRRQCVDSNFESPFGNPTTFTCHKKCVIPNMTTRNGHFEGKNKVGDHEEHGSTSRLICDEGFSNPTTEYLCTDGSFPVADNLLTCYADCTPRDIGNLKEKPKPIVHDATFSYVCNTDFSMHPDANNKLKCHDSTLMDATTNAPPVRYPSCHKVCKPEDFTTVPDATSPSGPINHGSTGTYVCKNSDYAPHIDHKATRTCEDGTLKPLIDSNNPLACFKKCPVPDWTNKFGTPSHTKPLVTGEQLTITCDQTHNGFGAMPRTCQSGQYAPDLNAVPFNCYKRCMIKTVTDAKHDKDETATEIKHGTEITYTCKQHYSFDDSNTFTTKCEDGNYEKDPGLCHPMCEVKNEPSVRTRTPDQTHYRNTQSFELGCTNGYSSADVHSTRTCTANGNLDKPLSTHAYECLPDCDVDNNVPHASIDTPGLLKVKNGKSALYKCNSDADFQKDNSAYPDASLSAPCLRSKLNVANVICKQKCDYPKNTGSREVAYLNDVIAPASPPAKVKHGDKVGFKCKADYMFATGSNLETATCTNGVLDVTTSNFICYKKCTVVTPIKTRYLQTTDKANGEKVNHLANVDFKCFDGFMFASGPPTKPITCDSGILDTASLSCFQKCQVKELDNATPLSPTAVNHGARFNYACKDGYDAVEGKTNSGGRDCINGKIIPSLEDSPFECHAMCKVTTPKNGILPNGVAEGSRIKDGRAVTFSCQPNFSTTADLTVTCKLGKLVNFDLIKCNPDCTVQELSFATSKPAKDVKIKFGQKVEYTCKPDSYTPSNNVNEPQMVACPESGTIDTSIVRCDKKCVTTGITTTVDAKLQSGQSSKVNHGSMVKFDCTSNFGFYSGSAKTSYEIECKNGALDTTTRYCHQKCVLPALTSLKHVKDPSKSELWYGEDITYECSNDYFPTVTTKMTRKCVANGKLDFPFLSNGISCVKKCIIGSSALSSYSSTMHDFRPIKDNSGGIELNHGDTLVITCKTGYRARNTPTGRPKCNSGNLEGTVNDANPDCVQECSLPDVSDKIRKWIKASDQSEITKLDYGDTAEAVCLEGYQSSQMIATYQCGQNANFQVCQIQCGVPASGSHRTCKVGAGSCPKYVSPGVKVTMKCNPGYAAKNEGTYTCSSDGIIKDLGGNAIGIRPDCKSNCETEPPKQPNADVNWPSSIGYVKNAAFLTFACESNFKTESGTAGYTLTCSAGTFQRLGERQCFPVCSTVPTLSNGAQSDYDQSTSYYQTSTVSITCSDSLFDLPFGVSSAAECTNGKFQSGAVDTFSCHRKCFYTLNDVANTVTPSKSLRHDEELKLDPAPGYGTDNEKSLTVKCNNGVLDKSKVVIKRVCSMEDYLSGFIDYSAKKYLDGDYLNLQCKNGYTLVASASQLQCTSTGKFTPVQASKCSKDCKMLSLSEYSLIATNAATNARINFDDEIPYGTSIEVRCENGKTGYKTDGSKFQNSLLLTTECGITETLKELQQFVKGTAIKGTEGSFKSCYSPCTGVPTTLSGGQVVTKHSGTIDHGTTITFRCDDDHNHIATAQMSVQCENGVFKAPECFRKCDVPTTRPPNTKPFSNSKVDHQATLEIQCKDSYIMTTKTQHIITCDRGTLSDTFNVVCELKCTTRPATTATYSWPQKNYLDLEETLDVKCNSPKAPAHNVVSRVKCVNGNIAPFLCYPKCDASSITSNTKALGDLTHNRPFKLECVENSDAENSNGPAERVCVDGEIIPSGTFKCNKRCTAPNHVSILKDETDLIHGQRVLYECLDTNKTPTRGMKYECKNGILYEVVNNKITTKTMGSTPTCT